MDRDITGPMVFCHCIVCEYYAIIHDLSSIVYHVLESVWCSEYHTFRVGGYAWHGNVFRIEGLLWRESSSCRCILSTKMSNSEYYWVICCYPEEAVEQTVDCSATWDVQRSCDATFVYCVYMYTAGVNTMSLHRLKAIITRACLNIKPSF